MRNRYNANKDFQAFVCALLDSGRWEYIPPGSRKHGTLRHLPSGSKLPVPGSPGGHPRGLKNFKTMVRKIERTCKD